MKQGILSKKQANINTISIRYMRWCQNPIQASYNTETLFQIKQKATLGVSWMGVLES